MDLSDFSVFAFAVVKVGLAIKWSKKAGEGTSRHPHEAIRAEAPSQPADVLNPTHVSGLVRLASPSPLEQGKGSSSHPSGPVDGFASLSPPTDFVVVSSGDSSLCQGTRSSW